MHVDDNFNHWTRDTGGFRRCNRNSGRMKTDRVKLRQCWPALIGLACGLYLPSNLAAAPADTAAPITIDEAAREAVSWHPSVEEAKARLDERSILVDVAEAGYMPQISGGIGTGYNNLSQSRWRPRASLSVSQMLYDFGKVRGSVDSAKAGTEIGRAQLLLSVDSLIRDTSYAVIELQRSGALRAIAADQLESVGSIRTLVQRRFEEGAATKADMLQVEARVQAAQATIQEIETEEQRWQTALAHFLGREAAPPISPEVPDGFMQYCAFQDPDWSAIPAMQEVEAQRDQATAERKRSRAENLPTVSLGASGSADINDPFGDREELNFGINISTSLFNGGANRARSRGADYALSAAIAAEARVRNQVSRTLRETQNQAFGLGRVLDTLTFRETSMRETGMLYRMQYLELGTKTLVDLLNAEQELHQVRFDRMNTQQDLRRLQIDCMVNSGSARAAFGLAGADIRGIRL